MRTAVISACFGAFRDEASNGIDFIDADPEIDYLFFTDDKKLRSTKWKVIFSECPADDMDHLSRARAAAKLAKFTVQDDYDAILWVDCKMLVKNRRGVPPLSISATKVSHILDSHPKCDVWSLFHWCRDHPLQELQATLQQGLENPSYDTTLKQALASKSLTLSETCCLLYRTKSSVRRAFARILDLIRQHKVRRDQNVFDLGTSDISCRKYFLCDVCSDQSDFGRWVSRLHQVQRKMGVGSRFRSSGGLLSYRIFVPFG